MNGFTRFQAGNSGSNAPPPQQQRSSIDSMQNGSRVHEERNGSIPMPVTGPLRAFGGMTGEMQGFGPTEMPRSPPKNKNTQHVPCKFFLQGTCQAGRTCPFSHDVESTTRPAPCKYFAKGGCKFGRKCALLHITPDGTVINRGPPYPPPQQAPGASLGPFPQPVAPGLLSMQAQGLERRPNGDKPPGLENYQYSNSPRNGYDYSQIDMTYTSASPQYGSPPQDSRLANSPPGRGLSVLDAPLPNSFDSNGISMAARNGPFAASVPSRFGVESPPSSLPRKQQLGNTALRDLHNSAFGDRGMDGVLAGSSPPSGPDEPLTFPKRPLHSDRLRAPRQMMISASLGTKLPTQSFEYSDDEGGDTDREDLLPPGLLLDEDRMGRESRPHIEDENDAATFLANQRRTISGNGTPQESKIGSPSYSSSPSRFSATFSRNPNERSTSNGNVGSPSRSNGFFNLGFSSSIKNGDLSPPVNSPPRQASMSMLTQELQRTKLDNKLTQAAASVGMTRTLSNGSNQGRRSLDRALSSASVGRERIDEEQELFDMDEVGDPSRTAPRAIIANNGVRTTGSTWSGKHFGSPPGNSESTFGAIGGHRMAK